MAKTVHDDVLDAALDKIATANVMTLCSAQPTTRTEAITTYMLADVTMTVGDGNGDYTIANGDASGRKLTMTAQAVPALLFLIVVRLTFLRGISKSLIRRRGG
jgi:hypothetical protein